MRAMWALVATALVLGSGCVKQDWIDRTLVTVDVTGNWHGRSRLDGLTPSAVEITPQMAQARAHEVEWEGLLPRN